MPSEIKTGFILYLPLPTMDKFLHIWDIELEVLKVIFIHIIRDTYTI